jgi:serine/threonine protein kinase
MDHIPKRVGVGAFGSIYNPAFKNKSKNGKIIDYPNQVTKIYFKKNAYNKSLENAEKVKAVLGENIGIGPYMHKYKLSNLKGIIEKGNESKLQMTTREENPELHMLHMQYLGKDFFEMMTLDVAKTLSEDALLNLPMEILKVIGQVMTLKQRNLIHCDIRDVNIMIHPMTGKLTIIDFDLLTTCDNYFDKQTKYILFKEGISDEGKQYVVYSPQYYQLPPEFLAKEFLQYKIIELLQSTDSQQRSMIIEYMNIPYMIELKKGKYYGNGPPVDAIFPWKRMYNIPKIFGREAGSFSPLITSDNIDNIVVDSIITILNKYKRDIVINYNNRKSDKEFNDFLIRYLNDIFLETADSYGLAGGLLCLIASVEHIYKDKIFGGEARELYKDYLLTQIKEIILAMASPIYRYRISPEYAYELISPIVKEYADKYEKIIGKKIVQNFSNPHTNVSTENNSSMPIENNKNKRTTYRQPLITNYFTKNSKGGKRKTRRNKRK